MSAIVIIAIVVAVLLVLALVAVFAARRTRHTELLRERQASEAAGHRQEADAHAAKAQQLAPQAEALRREATEHAALASEEAARASQRLFGPFCQGEPLNLDAHGYPTSLPADTVARTIVVADSGLIPGGRYRARWAGTGAIEIPFGVA
ncbi:MAG TPA: hypothetical protein VE078_09970, partial [Thermoanaerobaculia bacterium]|nr:hypothetical protein [Thermoanaerobaculia bacterium]